MDNNAELLAELARLKAENEKLKQAAVPMVKPLTFKVSEKGAVSVYGLNARFPVTLYKDQWVRILDKVDDLLAFIEANDDKLTTKPQK